MESNHFRQVTHWPTALLGLVFLSVVIVVACNGPIGPDPTPTPTPAEESPSDQLCQSYSDPKEYDATHYYVKGQVIVIGDPAWMDEQLGRPGGGPGPVGGELGLALLAGCDLSFLTRDKEFPFPPPGEGRTAADAAAPDQLALRLYGFEDEQGWQVLEVVNRINGAGNPAVFADPNLLVGHLATSPCADPLGIEGSPLGIEGSPLGIEGSPGGGLGKPALDTDFWPQWAFQAIGVVPPGNSALKVRGEGVRVVVFDTSPFSQPSQQPVSISTANQAFDLTVWHPSSPTQQAAQSTVSPIPDMANHGLFVTGLAQAVAPAAHFTLVRVLDDKGCGDLFTLNKALLETLWQMTETADERGGLVFNLSLGVMQPTAREVDRLSAEEQTVLSQEMVSLRTAILAATGRGVAIVAAAGNDSAAPLRRLDGNLPAAYAEVMGVAASTLNNGPACYSNEGDVVAPGGDAQLTPPPGQGDPYCQSLADQCPSLAAGEGSKCEWGLISLYTKSSGQYGYAYWVGTSFATPLVSGLAALAYEGRPLGTAERDQVYAIIQQDLTPLTFSLAPEPDFGQGIINVPDSLTP